MAQPVMTPVQMTAAIRTIQAQLGLLKTQLRNAAFLSTLSPQDIRGGTFTESNTDLWNQVTYMIGALHDSGLSTR
jgi:hypothetical protein